MSTVPPETSASSVVVPDEPPPNLVFDYPGADIILLSRDSREFRVPKLYIVNSSPVLGELIKNTSNSSGAAHTEGSLPTVQLSISGAILHGLFTFIFPVSPILPSTIEEIMELLSVAQEYQMNSTMAHIRGSIALQDSSSTDAFRVYSLAQKYGLRQEALQAARTILTFSMTVEDLEDKLDIMPGASLHELWKYHVRVRTLLTSDLAKFRESGARGTMTGLHCTEFGPSLIPCWLDGYIESIGETPNLFDPAEFDTTFARHIRAEGHDPRCACASITSQTIRTFWTALTATVHGSIEEAGSALSLVQDEVNSQVKSKLRKKNSSRPKPLEIPDADLILRSADLVHFRVHKSLLSMASPFFKDLLSLPQPPDSEVVDGLPIVQLSEDAELLSYLIPMLYPVRPVIPGPWLGDKTLPLLAACQKYDMDSIQSLIRAEVGSRPSHNPWGPGAFHTYAMASSKGLTPEMENAARLTLDYPMTFETLGEGLRLFEGWALRDLVRFRKRCRDNVVACLDSFLEVRAGPSKIWVGCPDVVRHSRDQYGRSVQTNDSLPIWLCEVFSRKKDNMQGFTHAIARPSSIREDYLAALKTHTDCNFCLRVHATEGQNFCAKLENELMKARNKYALVVAHA